MKVKVRNKSRFFTEIVSCTLAFTAIVGLSNYKVTTSAEVAFNTVETLTMKPGASIRMDDPSGIRFSSYIDDSLLDTTNGVKFKGGKELGIMVVPTRYLKNNYDYSTNVWKSDLFDFVKINYNKDKQDFSYQFKDNEIKNENGNYVINGVLVNIKEDNYIQSYQAVSYYVSNDGVYNYSRPSDDRTINEVAQAALNDATNNYTEEQKAVLTNINTVSNNKLSNKNNVNLNKSLANNNIVAGENMKVEVVDEKLVCSAVDNAQNPRETVTIYFDKPCTKVDFNVLGEDSIVDLQVFPVLSKKGENVVLGGDYHPICWAPTANYALDFSFPKENEQNVINGIQVSIAGQDKFATFSVSNINTNVVKLADLNKIILDGNIVSDNTNFTYENGKILCTPNIPKSDRQNVDIYFDNPSLYGFISFEGVESIVDLQAFPILSEKGENVVLGGDYHPICWKPTSDYSYNLEFPKAGEKGVIYGIRLSIAGQGKNVKFNIFNIATDDIYINKKVDLTKSAENGLIKNYTKDGVTTTTKYSVNNGKLVIDANKDTESTIGSGIYVYFNEPIRINNVNNMVLTIKVNNKTHFIDVAPVLTPIDAENTVHGGESADRVIWAPTLEKGNVHSFNLNRNNFKNGDAKFDYVYGIYIDGRPTFEATLNYELKLSYSSNCI